MDILEKLRSRTGEEDVNLLEDMLETAKYAILARRSGNTWYVAGINGTDQTKTLTLDLRFLGKGHLATIFADSGKGDTPWDIKTSAPIPQEMTCQARGGFLMVIPTQK